MKILENIAALAFAALAALAFIAVILGDGNLGLFDIL